MKLATVGRIRDDRFDLTFEDDLFIDLIELSFSAVPFLEVEA